MNENSKTMTERHYGFGDLLQKFDENFEGSLWQKMGYSNELCPVCGAHLRSGICLNACHLNCPECGSFDVREVCTIKERDWEGGIEKETIQQCKKCKAVFIYEVAKEMRRET